MTKQKLKKWAKDLFPMNRSLTGKGNRETLNYLKKNITKKIKIKAVKSNRKIYSWRIPKEWLVNKAYLKDEDGKIISNFERNNLELLGYSRKFKKKLEYKDLKKHIFFSKKRPNAVPYVTSYYKKNWGFCMSYKKFKLLDKNKKYFVNIDTKLFNGKMNYGELLIKGKSKKEILICTYICHPSMANNELSGILATSLLTQQKIKLKYSLRFIFIPETIGAVYFINKNFKHLKNNLIAGFNLSCVGLDSTINVINTIDSNTYADLICKRLAKKNKKIKFYSFKQRGSNERQFGCQNLKLPFVTISRKKFGHYKEYHTSDDNLKILNYDTIIETVKFLTEIIKEINKNDIFEKQSYCEPFLANTSLIKNIATTENQILKTRVNIQNFLAYVEKSKDLKYLSNLLKIKIKDIKLISKILLEKKIIKQFI